MAEHLVPLHAQLADLARGRGAAVDIEQVRLFALAPQGEGEHAAIGRGAFAQGRLHHHRAGAVAEQHAGGAIGPVEDPGHLLGADDQAALGVSPRDEAIGDAQGVDEARAHRLDVEGDPHGRAQLALHDGGGGREGQVRRGGGHDDEVEVLGGAASRGEGLLRRLDGKIGDRLIRGGAPALVDPGAFEDPIIGRVDDLRQVLVGEHLFGKVGTDACDGGTQQRHVRLSISPASTSARRSMF